MIRIVLVTPLRVYAEAIATALERDNQLSVSGASTDFDSAVAIARERHPHIVLVDLAVANPMAGIRLLRSLCRETKVVAFAPPDREEEWLDFAECGVSGFIHRDVDMASLTKTLRDASQGELACSGRLAGALLERVAALAGGQPGPSKPQLTARELEILALLERGFSNKDIARDIGIEIATVKNHVHSILSKMQVHRRGQAAARMRRA